MDLAWLEYNALITSSEIAAAAVIVRMKMQKVGGEEKIIQERTGSSIE
jgi:hypothetical protein